MDEVIRDGALGSGVVAWRTYNKPHMRCLIYIPHRSIYHCAKSRK